MNDSKKMEAIAALEEVLSAPPKPSNYDGITLVEWMTAAGLDGKHYDSMWHESCVVSAARDAWMRGDDPTDYRNNISYFELFYNSTKDFK